METTTRGAPDATQDPVRPVGCRRIRRRPERERRHRHGHHLLSQGADHGLQEGLRGRQPRHHHRDPEQEHHGRRGLHPRAARGPAPRRDVGQRARRLRGAGQLQAAAKRARGGQQKRAGQDRQLSAERPQGHVLRPGAGRLRDRVEHALPQGQQAGRAQGVDRPGAARILRPHRHLLALALGHDAAHGGDHLAGRRLGQGLVAALADHGQRRRRHRPQLCRARRREQRPVRHRHRDRLSGAGGQVLGLSGGLHLPQHDGGGAGQHRAGGRRQERGRGQDLHGLHHVGAGPAVAVRAQDRAPAHPALQRAEAARGLPGAAGHRQARQGAVQHRVVG